MTSVNAELHHREFDREDPDVYAEHGYQDRRHYLRCMADDYGVDLTTVYMLADMLGPSEDFDGLLIALEDAQEE